MHLNNEQSIGMRSVGAAWKVSPNWSQETMTCHVLVLFRGEAPLVTSLPSRCYMPIGIINFSNLRLASFCIQDSE